MDVRGKRVLVVGMARSGLAAARCLSGRGALVTVTDQRHPSAFPEEMRELLELKIGLELGAHREQTFTSHDLIVVSPGVPADLAPLQAARNKGIPVVPEVEVASWFLEGRLVGITGTNGKTTTTALAGKILKASGFDPFVGGNIGVPLISALDRDPQPSVLLVELSSFQLETIQNFRPRVAALLNLTPNHLDRHPSFEAYAAAKARIFENQTEQDFAILNADDLNVLKLTRGIRSRKIFFSRQQQLADGLFVSQGRVLYRVRQLERPLFDVRDIRLRGEFNLENVLAASAMGCVLGADFGALRQAVREFGGVEHRLEFVREIAGVSFYNDSKATSVDAALKALQTFDRGVHLILGGKDKGAPYAPLRALMKDRVREVLTIGAAAEKIERELAGSVEIDQAGTLEIAIRHAFERAETGDSILLSPACSSYDQFENFEQRGKLFKEIAATLAVETSAFRARETATRSPNRTAQSLPGGPESESLFSGAAFAPGAELGSNVGTPEEMEAVLPAEMPAPVEPAGASPRLPRPSVSRELEYVYEVSAEEVFGDADASEPAQGMQVEVERDQNAPCEEPESLDDEAMAYEIRSSAQSMDGSSRASGKGSR